MLSVPGTVLTTKLSSHDNTNMFLRKHISAWSCWQLLCIGTWSREGSCSICFCKFRAVSAKACLMRVVRTVYMIIGCPQRLSGAPYTGLSGYKLSAPSQTLPHLPLPAGGNSWSPTKVLSNFPSAIAPVNRTRQQGFLLIAPHNKHTSNNPPYEGRCDCVRL